MSRFKWPAFEWCLLQILQRICKSLTVAMALSPSIRSPKFTERGGFHSFGFVRRMTSVGLLEYSHDLYHEGISSGENETNGLCESYWEIVTSETEELALNVNRQEVSSGSGYFFNLFPSSAAKIVVLMSLWSQLCSFQAMIFRSVQIRIVVFVMWLCRIQLQFQVSWTSGFSDEFSLNRFWTVFCCSYDFLIVVVQ